jgi:hypothetical protein
MTGVLVLVGMQQDEALPHTTEILVEATVQLDGRI